MGVGGGPDTEAGGVDAIPPEGSGEIEPDRTEPREGDRTTKQSICVTTPNNGLQLTCLDQ
jgi:hypothetical protein